MDESFAIGSPGAFFSAQTLEMTPNHQKLGTARLGTHLFTGAGSQQTSSAGLSHSKKPSSNRKGERETCSCREKLKKRRAFLMNTLSSTKRSQWVGVIFLRGIGKAKRN